jgi:NAD(P)-dependent dehydrogenase (short-subunit alcohol dehydrogenase family)
MSTVDPKRVDVVVHAAGVIINFSTSVKKVTLPTYGPHTATKGAVDALSPILAKELHGRDIAEVVAFLAGPGTVDQRPGHLRQRRDVRDCG